MIFFLSLMLLVWEAFRLMVNILIRIIVIIRYKGCGIWVMTAGHLALQLGGRGDGGSRRASQPDDGERGGSRTGGGEAQEEALSMEDLRRKYSWWPSGSGKEPVTLIDMEAMDGEGATLRGIKSTKL
jgi:hypothetical protein